MIPGRAAAALALIALAGCSPQSAAPTPRFIEESAASGIVHAYDGDWEFYVGGGVAVFDCSGDGRPDLWIAGGSNPSALYRNESRTAGELRFSRVAAPEAEVREATGGYPLDVDGDGITDLAVLRVGENVLFRGLGECRFERANEAWGFDGGAAWSTAFSARWEGNGWPTLAVGNYVDKSAPGAPFGTCHHNELHRPAPSGEGYGPPVPLRPGYCALSMLFSDWNRSGQADLFITNDRHYYRGGEEQLWRVPAGQPPALYTREQGWQPLQINGMGIASYDLTGDGYPEYYFTSMGDNKLRALAAGPDRPEYRDLARARGVTAHRPFAGGDVRPSTAWPAEFCDVNNDGYIDLFVAKGNVEAMEEAAATDPNNLLLGRPDGTFVEAAEGAGLLSYARARGAAMTDLNLDGLLDLIVVNRRENVKVWRNVGRRGGTRRPQSPGRWVALRLRQSGGNRDAVGAWIEVEAGGRTLRREVTVGGGHAGGRLGWGHFGVGRARQVRARVQWPDGAWGPWVDLASNQFVYLERGTAGEDRAVPWNPPP